MTNNVIFFVEAGKEYYRITNNISQTVCHLNKSQSIEEFAKEKTKKIKYYWINKFLNGKISVRVTSPSQVNFIVHFLQLDHEEIKFPPDTYLYLECKNCQTYLSSTVNYHPIGFNVFIKKTIINTYSIIFV